MGERQFRTFEDLEVYQAAREFRKSMYGVSRRLPDFEKYELASQIRRASVSLTNNIAEGHGRYHFADQIRFQLQARGSLEELIDDLNVCTDEDYLGAADIEKLRQSGWHVLALINGYIRYLRNRRSTGTSALYEAAAPYTACGDTDALTDEALTPFLPFNDLTI